MERAVLHADVENQAILELININKQKDRAIKNVCEMAFCFPMQLMSDFFLSSVKIQTCQD